MVLIGWVSKNVPRVRWMRCQLVLDWSPHSEKERDLHRAYPTKKRHVALCDDKGRHRILLTSLFSQTPLSQFLPLYKCVCTYFVYYTYNKCYFEDLLPLGTFLPLSLSHSVTFGNFSSSLSLGLKPILLISINWKEILKGILRRWAEHPVVIRMASRRDRGHLRKTRSWWTTYKSMVVEAGEHCPRMQVNGPSSSFLSQN